MRYLLLVGTLAVLGSIAFLLWTGASRAGINASGAGNNAPPTRLPAPGTGGIDTDPDDGAGFAASQSISGHGKAEAAAALNPILATLPFRPHLSTTLPPEMSLVHVAGNLEGPTKDRTSFDATYLQDTAAGQLQFHTFQTPAVVNLDAAPAAKTHWVESKPITIDGETWQYHLLVFPQPDNGQLRLHEIDRTFADGVHVELGLRSSGGESDEALLARLVAFARGVE